MVDERDRKNQQEPEEQDDTAPDEDETVTGAPLETEEEDPDLDSEADSADDDDDTDEDDDEDDDLHDSDEPVELSAKVEPEEGSEPGDADTLSEELAAGTTTDEEPKAGKPRPVSRGGKKKDDEQDKPEPEVTEHIGVILMAYGGPDKLEDVPEYLLDVRSGRPMDQELVDEFVERYSEIGGRSPILELTQAQAKGVEKALNNRKAREAGIKYTTYVGMRHWHPYIRDVVPQIVEDGVDKLVGIVMAPHYSKMSVGKYMEQLREGLEKAGSEIPVHEVHSWKDQPMFISGVSSRIRDALRKYPADIRKEVPVVFTAHSLPTRILEWGDEYPDELRVSVEMVADRVRQRHWRFAYQSQGASAEPWLGPEVEETLEELAAEGFKHVLMVPIGFVCDHVEILYDVDIEHKEHAEKLGMELSRIKSLNDGPMLCRAVAEAVRKAHDPSHVSEEVEPELAGVADED
jgi:protoporphyrin/coproporphyrin ferrochelatase